MTTMNLPPDGRVAKRLLFGCARSQLKVRYVKSGP